MGKNCAVIALLTMAILTLSCGVQAEETKGLQTDNVTAEEKLVRFMFVQNAQSGTLVPVAGEDNLYALTLMGISPQTIAFSDRPERIVTQAPMQKFLDGMCFSSQDGPNAALEILAANGEEDLAVVELFAPAYDAANQSLKYNVSFLEQPNLSYAAFNERADKALPETFGPAALFIDDCADSKVYCCQRTSFSDLSPCEGPCRTFGTGCCWKGSDGGCKGCHSDDYYKDKCKEKFGKDYTICIHNDCFW
jgi:hypothetical protein